MDNTKLVVATAVGVTTAVAANLLINYVTDTYHVGEDSVVFNFDKQASGGDLVAKVLKSQGVKFIFTLIGGHISPILISCDREGVRVIDVRHEVTAVFAADAVSRISGIPGVAAVTAGPGLTNTVTAVKNAQMAQSPLILLGGATSDLLKGKGSLQDIDQFALLTPHCKWTKHVSRVEQIVPALEYAFHIAQSGTPGPVFIEFPIDTLYPQPIASGWYLKSKQDNASIANRVINAYMSYHLGRIFSCLDKNITIHKPAKISVTLPSSSWVSKTVRILREAQHPVLLVGAQALLLGSGSIKPEQLQLAVQSLNIPTFTSNMARGLLGPTHPNLFRHCRAHALRNADVVILAGVVCDFRLSYGQSINRNATVISINRDKTDLYKNRSPTYAYNADPATFLVELARSMESAKLSWRSWEDDLSRRDIQRSNEINAKASENVESSDGFLNPLAVLQKFDQLLPQKSVMVADGGDFVGSAAYIVRPRGPLCWLDPGPFGTLGVGAGFALGAKLCRPDHDVWVIFGDGACGYSIPEYDTFVRHKIAVGALVGNDACWMQIMREQAESLKSEVACNLAYTNYDQVVKAFGGEGFKVNTIQQLTDAMVSAKTYMDTQSLPVLINCIIARTDFRKGSISV
ncbi:thiamine pyrophosphate-binding enzyme family protein [Heterostelium album PN500]|uniref:Thiamine pyrophosphate-binding enzyme family protein n=1 Tax=Heterostelium pallidum (strain ATCC 26659 / Pp 5 / PN500) TaxID=670386 RepID=D3B6S5_HETP5|nr:thiamine pyrophosphate-binding enzyme family protein [Heterostelium album PN500]EFA83045.1 thiamine pyrophosphate-binding enzyme family protein [Heterostelium album PN500]|eukprot:XP_020435162.1 thiamine pyrophosphate-binding enzyme family protein [Heterostelium album PN500]